MKKLLSISMFMLALSAAPAIVNAQSSETTESYNKTNVNGFVVNVEGAKDVVNTSLDDYFKRIFNGKSSSSKGYKLYKGVIWPEVSSEKLDVYYKVNNKKNNNQVTMLVSKGYDNFVSSQSDPQIADAVKYFMNTIQDKAIAVSNANAIIASQKALDDAQKEYDRAVKKESDLNKDKERIEKDIASQTKTISEKEQLLNKAKAELEAAKARN